MRRIFRLFIYATLTYTALAHLGACTESDEPAENVPDVIADTKTEDSQTSPDGSGLPGSDAVKDTEAPPAGEPVIVRWFDETEIFASNASAEGEFGDLLVENEHVRFVVHGPDPSDNYLLDSYQLIDIDSSRELGDAGFDVIKDYSPLFGLRIFVPESMEIIADGSDGGEAVIEVRGHDESPEVLAALANLPIGGGETTYEIIHRYRLAPGDRSITLETEVTNIGDETRSVDLGDFVLFSHHGARMFGLPNGFEQSAIPGENDLVGVMTTHNDLTVGLFNEGGTPSSVLIAGFEDTALLMLYFDDAVLAPGESTTYSRQMGGARDANTLTAARRKTLEEETAIIEGQVLSSATGEGVTGARVHALGMDDDTLHSMAVTQADGSYQLHVPAGSVRLMATAHGIRGYMDFPDGFGSPDQKEAHGFHPSEVAELDAIGGETTLQDLTVSGSSWAEIKVRDDNFQLIPAMITFKFTETTPAPASMPLIGYHPPRGFAAQVAWTADGEATIPVPPGTYDVVFSRGFEWSLDTLKNTVFEAGETASLFASLIHQVDSSGWRTMDAHMHASPSNHGDASMADRIMVNVANDLDVFLASDHDKVADYNPVIESLGLTHLQYSVISDEISTSKYDHMNAFPLIPIPEWPNDGAPIWWNGMDLEAISTHVRELLGAAHIQINHGLDGGFFDLAGYDPTTGEAANPDRWFTDFQAMEIINATNALSWDPLVVVWSSLLNLGHRVAGTGVSDTHTRWKPGYGRTYFPSTAETLKEAGNVDYTEAITQLATVVSGGAFPVLRSGSAGIGDTVTPDALGQVPLEIEVQAAPWMGSLPHLHLRENGQIAYEADVALNCQENLFSPTHYNCTILVEPTADAWYQVEVRGDTPMPAVYEGALPYGITGPLFVDVAGDGWDPPGLGGNGSAP